MGTITSYIVDVNGIEASHLPRRTQEGCLCSATVSRRLYAVVFIIKVLGFLYISIIYCFQFCFVFFVVVNFFFFFFFLFVFLFLFFVFCFFLLLLFIYLFSVGFRT